MSRSNHIVKYEMQTFPFAMYRRHHNRIMSDVQAIIDTFAARAIQKGTTDASIVKMLRAVLGMNDAQKDGSIEKIGDFAQARLTVAMGSMGTEEPHTMGRAADLLEQLMECAGKNQVLDPASDADLRHYLCMKTLIPTLGKMGYIKTIDSDTLPDDRVRKAVAEFIAEGNDRIVTKPPFMAMIKQALDKVDQQGGTLPNDMPQGLRAKVVEGAKFMQLVDPALTQAVMKMQSIPEAYQINTPAHRHARSLLMRALAPYVCYRMKQAGLDLTTDSIYDMMVVNDPRIPLCAQTREPKKPFKRERSRSPR